MNTSNLSDVGLPPEAIQEASLEKTVQDYHANPIPELDKAKTAVFTSEWSGDIYPYSENELHAKISEDVSRLVSLGYDTMIVNTGTRYGMLALKILSEKTKEMPFRLILAKIRGELLEKPNIQVAAHMTRCECFWYAESAKHYKEVILTRASYISDEVGLRKI